LYLLSHPEPSLGSPAWVSPGLVLFRALHLGPSGLGQVGQVGRRGRPPFPASRRRSSTCGGKVQPAFSTATTVPQFIVDDFDGSIW